MSAVKGEYTSATKILGYGRWDLLATFLSLTQPRQLWFHFILQKAGFQKENHDQDAWFFLGSAKL